VTSHPLAHLLDRPIAYHRIFVTLTGGVAGAVFLSQAVYWQQRVPNGRSGWWWKKQSDWADETGLSRREFETARRRLRDLGILSYRVGGMPKKTWYKLHFDQLEHQLTSLTAQNGGSDKTVCTERTNQNVGSGETVCSDPPDTTETTAETTSETTTTTTPRDGAGVGGGGDDSPDSNPEATTQTQAGAAAEIPTELLDRLPDGIDRAVAAESLAEAREQDRDEIVQQMQEQLGRLNYPLKWLGGVCAKSQKGQFEHRQRRQRFRCFGEGIPDFDPLRWLGPMSDDDETERRRRAGPRALTDGDPRNDPLGLFGSRIEREIEGERVDDE